MQLARSHHVAEERDRTNWDRARLSVVVPIGVIVAVAIVCIVVAVLSSAQRADDFAAIHERQLLTGALRNFGDRVLREVESVATSDGAKKNIRVNFDSDWAKQHIGGWLVNYFDHDYVFIYDGNDKPLLAFAGRHGNDANWVASGQSVLGSVLEYMRGRDASLVDAIGLDPAGNPDGGTHSQAVAIKRMFGRPVVVAATTVGFADSMQERPDASAPIIVSVKAIDKDVLAGIATQVRLANLRKIGTNESPSGDYIYELDTPKGDPIARFAWTPKQPGAEIVNSVVPFITVALAGFALLAAFVLRYMRRTALAIATGESRLRYLAMHDPLCGLPNRIFFGERLEAVIDEVRAGATPAAVFYIDLDHFKDVNDTLGHPVGDELIRNVTLRLSRTLRAGDLVARLGGDEFAVISSIGDSPDQLMTLAHRIIATICAPYAINQQNIVIGASIGIAIVDRNCGDAADIMRYADMALYRAKNEGRNRACIYDTAMDTDLSNRKLLETDLREAIENSRLYLLYQPIVDKTGKTVVGVEALCRWTHPTRGEIPPSEFIAAAEHSGLIIELGAWVLKRACTDGNNWPGLSVSVNVSALQFRRTDFVEVVERTLAEANFDPARLELELTENVLIGNIETAEACMLRLKALGVRLALDDFGTGYSSLLYLRRLPFDKLKIDRSFVGSIEKAADAAAIVHAVVSLGRGLGMKVTAEGVETADQQLFLRAAGVHCLQGYRFGKPMSAAEITSRLRNTAEFQPTEPAALAS